MRAYASQMEGVTGVRIVILSLLCIRRLERALLTANTFAILIAESLAQKFN